MLAAMTPEQKADLLNRLTRMASVGATILSNASAAKKVVESIQTSDEASADTRDGFGREPFGADAFGH